MHRAGVMTGSVQHNAAKTDLAECFGMLNSMIRRVCAYGAKPFGKQMVVNHTP